MALMIDISVRWRCRLSIQLQQEFEYQLCDASYKIVPKYRGLYSMTLGTVLWTCDLYVGPNLYPDAALYRDNGVLATPVMYVAPICFWDSFYDSPLNTEVDWGFVNGLQPPAQTPELAVSIPRCDCGHDKHKFFDGHARWCSIGANK